MTMRDRRHSPLRDNSAELAHCSVDRRFELLKQTQFFRHLADDALEDVNSRFQEVHFAQDEWLYHLGDPAGYMYVVAAGQVKLLQQGTEGKEVLLHLAAAGDLIGSLAAFGNTSYSDAAQAHTACCVLRVASSDFQQLLELHPTITLQVLEFAGTQLQAARETIRGLSVNPVEHRLASALLQLAERHGEAAAEGGIMIQIPLPQQDLAAMTGTTVETVSRVLSQFRSDGLITSGRRWIAITDSAALQAISNS
jgi:CRP-like cAMP-binding protein